MERFRSFIMKPCLENSETYNFGNIDFDSQSNNYNHILNFNSDFVSLIFLEILSLTN